MKYYDLHYMPKFDRPIGGYAKRWKIYILEKYRNDKGILEHEKCHVRQWYFTLGIHSILYRFADWYKLWAEVQAYKIQLKTNPPEWPDYTDLYAKFITNNYGLDVDIEDVKRKLRK